MALEPPPSRLMAEQASSSSAMNDASCARVSPGTPPRRPSATTKYIVFWSRERPTAVRGCAARVNASLPGSFFAVSGSQSTISAGQPEIAVLAQSGAGAFGSTSLCLAISAALSPTMTNPSRLLRCALSHGPHCPTVVPIGLK